MQIVLFVRALTPKIGVSEPKNYKLQIKKLKSDNSPWVHLSSYCMNSFYGALKG